jgi:hypothetical protein
VKNLDSAHHGANERNRLWLLKKSLLGRIFCGVGGALGFLLFF